jgi:hypothetical protein
MKKKSTLYSQTTTYAKERTADIKSVFDVSRYARFLQREPHFFCNPHESGWLCGRSNEIWYLQSNVLARRKVPLDKYPWIYTSRAFHNPRQDSDARYSARGNCQDLQVRRCDWYRTWGIATFSPDVSKCSVASIKSPSRCTLRLLWASGVIAFTVSNVRSLLIVLFFVKWMPALARKVLSENLSIWQFQWSSRWFSVLSAEEQSLCSSFTIMIIVSDLACRTRMSTGGLRPCIEEPITNNSIIRCDCTNILLGCLESHTSNHNFESVGQPAAIAGDISPGTWLR